ncbi:MAG: CvpA family protein [Patescibacteria group bacterium]|nr:CvpA family protein [Patescibacteria group bacterium]MDD4611302.1 CvpA family protein [Patescibacteria group bacterium]
MIAEATSSIYFSTTTAANLATSAAAIARDVAKIPIWEKIVNLPTLDIILGAALIGFVIYGLYFGLIRVVGSLLGIVIGAWLASHFYLLVSEWAKSLFFGHENLGKILTFIILFILINRLVSLIFMLIDRAYDIISIIPFLKTINRLAGAVLGFVEGALIIGIILYVASKYAPLGHWFSTMLGNSALAPFLLEFAKVLMPLLPEALKSVKSVI